MPENLRPEPSIKPLLQERRRRQKKGEQLREKVQGQLFLGDSKEKDEG